MRITTSDSYDHHGRCEAAYCERLYCNSHRWLYRLCESVKDRGDDGVWYTGECPRCHAEWEMKHEQELWEKHQACACRSEYE